MNALAKNERGLLAQCEDVIEAGKRTFVEVGKALAAIRDGKLYRETHGTFEAYCASRWGMARRTAYQLMDGAEAADNVRNCAQAPRTESQARPLTKLPPEQQAPAWQEAVEAAESEGRPVAARHVEQAVERRIEAPELEAQPTRKGVGIRYALEAIASLRRIPDDDPLRDEAFDTVNKWIKDNK